MFDDRELEFDAYNAALQLTLGLLAARAQVMSLLQSLPRSPHPSPPEDEVIVDAVLGLIATLDTVEAHAATASPPPQPPPRPARPLPSGVLR